MSVRLADLLADDGLNLVVRAGSRADLQREVRWCAVTELDDPRHWLPPVQQAREDAVVFRRCDEMPIRGVRRGHP